MDGFWNIDINVNDDTESHKNNGKVRVNRLTLLASFEQNNDNFTGYIVNGSNSACDGKDNTSISGSIKGKNVTWQIKYLGDCCHNAEMNFDGDLINTGAIVGKLEPSKLSSSEERCTLLWADVSMRQSGS